MRAKDPCPARQTLLLGLLVIVLCITAPSVTHAEATCSNGCTQSDDGPLQYEAGKVYEYSFDSVMTVALSADIGGNGGGETDDTNLKVVGTAKLFAEGNCGYTLQLGAVKVTATKESIEKRITQSIQRPVHFSMVGGRVQPEICVDPADTAYSLNVKRALISLLQASVEEAVTEVDVFGQCPTHTSVSKADGAEVVTKVRNLNACAYREQIRNGLISGVVNEKAGVHTTALLQGDYSKEARLERGIVESVQLVEDYTLVYGNKGGPGVRSKVVTTMKAKSVAGAPAAAPACGNHAASIIFQSPEVYATKNIAALKAALGRTVQLVDNYVQKDAGRHFVELIRLMRQADTDTLLDLAAFPHPNKVLARKVYLDSLFRTGTAEAVRAIVKQMNKMDDKEKRVALLSMNLARSVDKDTITLAAGLLNVNAPKEAFLAVGHLMAKYCQRAGCSSGDVDGVSKKFTDALKHCKANTAKDEERIVYVLKGIRNARHVAEGAFAALYECAAPGRSARIRVAALQAFSAAGCDAGLRQRAMELLRDRNEDSELRIEAYLAAIACPTAELANEIAEVVNTETVHQVGGFIASSLRVIRDSTDATREHQRHFLGNVRVTRHFPKDPRRYSFDNELSWKLDALGVSAGADYQLIYSQHGFLPRSGRLNVTTELFGTRFNVFEASVRQENLESVLEYYLGPKGLLNKDFDEIIEIIQTGGVGGSEAGRERRSIVDETAKFAKRYKTYGTKNTHDMNLDLSLKLFGSELMFFSLGDNVPESLEDVIKHFSTLFEDVKRGLASYNKEFHMHALFMDTEFAYPTGVGLPLQMSSQGFAANKLDFGIEFDVDAILTQDAQQAKYRVKLVPSVDVNVNMHLGFDAYVLSTGARVHSSLHSATGADARLEFIHDGHGFNLDVELPREKIDLVDLQLGTDFYIGEQDKDVRSVALKGANKRKPELTEDCFNQFEIVGFSICFASSVADFAKASTTLAAHGKAQPGAGSDGLQLARPFSFTLYMTSERRFNLRGSHVTQTTSGNQQWKLEYSTPGSQVSHDTTLTFELGTQPRYYGRVSFDHPQYHFALEAGVNNDQRELVLYGQYEFNDEVKKNKVGFVKSGNEYRPVIEIQDKNGVSNDINGYRVDGRVVVQETGEKQSRYQFENFQVKGKDGERLVVNGWADVGPVFLHSELHVSPGQESYLVKQNFKIADGEYIVGLFVNDEKTPDNVVGGSAQVKVAEKDVAVALSGKAFTWEAALGQAVAWEAPEGSVGLASSTFKTDLALRHKQQVVAAFKLSGLTEGQNKLQLDAELVRGKRTAALAVKFGAHQHSQGDYSLEVTGRMNKHFVELLATCEAKGTLFAVNNVLTTSWGTAAMVAGELGQRYTPQDIHVDLQGTAQFSGKDKPMQWMLKVIGAPERTTSEFKLSRDNADLIKSNGELQHPQDKITGAKINLQAKNLLTAKADFKVAKNGKGELATTVELLRTEPKHKVEVGVKFHVQAPKYDVETTITLDADKKLYFKTENSLDKFKFQTKNVAEVADKRLTFDANGLVKGEWRLNGELQGNFAATFLDGRVVDGSFKRKITTNARSGIGQGIMELHLNDQLPDGQKRSVTGSAKLEKLNLKAREFTTEGQLNYKHLDGRQFDLVYHAKHLPKNAASKSLDVGLTTSGNLVGHSANVAVVVDEYSAKHAIYRVTGKYGDLGSVNFNGNFKRGEHSEPSAYELQGSIQLPQTSFKTIEINSHGKVVRAVATEGGRGGIQMVQVHLDQKAGDQLFVRVNGVWKGGPQQGGYNLNVETQRMRGPLKVEGSYQREHEGNLPEGTESGKQKYTFQYRYAEQFVNTAADMSYAGADSVTLHYTLDSSFESTKAIEVTVRGQRLESDAYAVAVQAKQADKVYALDSKVFRSNYKKGLDLHATLPDGSVVVVVGVFELLGERKAKVTMDVQNLVDLDLSGSLEGAYKSVDDFYMIGQWNSAKLGLDHYDLDVRSHGKAITFSLKNRRGVVLAGSASYALKKEKNKAIIEGQGQLQHHGKAHSTNFKLIRQHYELAADKEIGFSYTFNGNYGPKNSVATLKITNRDFNVQFSVCEEKRQCTNVQVQSIVTFDEQDEVGSLQHSLLVLIDLRELGYPHEFELQTKTIRQGLKFQYSLDSNIISNNNMKYQLVASVLPSGSKVQIKLPTREILFETQQVFPPHGQVFGHYEHSAAFYFDKTNNPNDVTRLLASADVSGVERVALNVRGEMRLEYPTMRPLTVSGKLDANRKEQVAEAELVFDVFRAPEQQVVASTRLQNDRAEHGFNVTASQRVRSGGLGFEYVWSGHGALDTQRQEVSAGAEFRSGVSDLKASVFAMANRERAEIVVNGMEEQVLQIVGEFNRQKYTSKFSSKMQIFGQKPLLVNTELHPSQVKLAIHREGLVDASAELRLGKEAKFNVVGAGKQMFSGRVALDAAKFLQTTYEKNDEEIKTFLEHFEGEVKQETAVVRDQIKRRFQKLREVFERQIQLTKDVTPDFSQLRANYESSLNEIAKELENDPSLKQIIDTYRNLYANFAKIAGDVAKITAEAYERLHQSFVLLHEKLETIFTNTVLPAWEEFSVSLAQLVGELRVELLNLYSKSLQAALEVLEKYGPALKNYGKVLTDTMRPLNEIAQELYKVVAHGTEEFLDELKEYFAHIPSFEHLRAELKHKLEQMKLLEKTLEFVNNLFDQLHILPQSPETSDFLEKAHAYIVTKLRDQKVDDEQMLEELLRLLVKAVRSFWLTLEMNAPTGASSLSISGLGSLFTSLPYSVDIFAKLPVLLSFRTSVLNFWLNENWESLVSHDLLKSWIFFHDFELTGHVADGRHVITFDGQYVGFGGSCKYILAQDSFNNNFTVVAQLVGGKMKSVVLTDRDGSFVEVTDAGVLKVNGSPQEFPLHQSGVHAWRKFYTVWLRSEYGVEVMCTSDLKVCHVRVNGFYTSKIRGLLGNGNAEPHDDLVQVDGTVTTDHAAFGTGYALGKCVAAPENGKRSHEHAELCNELFGLDSPLALGYLAIDSAPYRAACDQAVMAAAEKDKEVSACTVATAYASALKLDKLFVMLPRRCLKCAGAAGQRDVGQEFTTKIPNNKADVVFIVDTMVTPDVLNHLVTPLVGEVRESLKARGFTDVVIAMIVYNEEQRYPALVTSDNGKINYHGKVAEVTLDGPKSYSENFISQVVSDKKVLDVYEIVERFVKSIVPQSDELAINMALNYPFRAGAAKSIVGIRSNALEYGNMFKLIRAYFTSAATRFNGAVLHMVGPVNDMSLEGLAAERLVGFNSRLVATLDGKDNKKRQKLKFKNDMGIDFVLNNGGWVFATHNFDKLKPEEQLKALNQVTASIADTLFKTEIVSDCKCVPVHGIHAQHHCTVKSSTFVPNKKPKAA